MAARPHLGRIRRALPPGARALAPEEAVRIGDALRALAHVAENLLFETIAPPEGAPDLGHPQQLHVLAWNVEATLQVGAADEAFLGAALRAYTGLIEGGA